MIYQKFSPRQRLAMTWWGRPELSRYDGVICDGSVRSGKTVAMTLGFVMWAMRRFEGQSFAICGKTIESLRRNVTTHLQDWLGPDFHVREFRTENRIVIYANGVSNTFYQFGGRDESSAALIQGITLAGVLLDEVALMPRSFVEQALARCSVTGAKLWFNCNPEGPQHWFYVNWVQKAQEQKMLRLHFTMDDNYSLAPETRERYERIYSSSKVFYDRFIRGLWVVAEGLVYPMFNEEFHVVPNVPRPYDLYRMSCDYGTINPTSVGLWGRVNGVWYLIREYYFDSRAEQRQRTDEEHYAALEKLAGNLKIQYVIVDPSAASFIECIERHGKYRTKKANNAVLDGIRMVATQLQQGGIKICEGCDNLIREMGMYRWDDKALEDRPIKQYDHAEDMTRYMCMDAFAPSLFSFT